MDINTITEFVYNEETFEYLRARVSILQGYFIRKPQPVLLSKVLVYLPQ